MSALARAVEPPRSRRLLTWSWRLGAIVAAAVGVKLLASRSGEPPAPAPPVSPILLPLAAPQLVVIPAPVVPPTVPEEPEVPEPRASAPIVRAECVTSANDIDELPWCAWDNGFPAISADGTTIATAFLPIDDGRGHPGLTIRLHDAASGRLVKSVLVLSPDEYVDADDPKRVALDRTIERRAARAQALLGGYRALVKLGTLASDAAATTTDGMRAEFDEGAVRLIDTAKNLAIWQRRFDVAKEFPDRKLDGEHCEPISSAGIAAAWDPATRTVVTSVSYLTGPEFCGSDVQRDYIARVAP